MTRENAEEAISHLIILSPPHRAGAPRQAEMKSAYSGGQKPASSFAISSILS